jgi:hypothetical protein
LVALLSKEGGWILKQGKKRSLQSAVLLPLRSYLYQARQ